MNPELVVVGSLNMDLVVRAERIPAPGETVPGGDLHTYPGGKGANQAVGVARLGARVCMVGRVGDDAHGQALRDHLHAAGVDTAAVLVTPGTASGVALIVVDAAGQNSIVVSAGANGRVAPADLPPGLFAGASVVLLQFEIPMAAVVRAAERARAAGCRVVLNPAPAHPLPPGLLPMVDVLVPNEGEAARLAGVPEGDPGAAARALVDAGAGAVVVTLGASGALVVEGDESVPVPAFPVTPVDTTAAGDAFVAGLAVALAEGRPLAEAARFGCAAGALAVTKAGAGPSLPARDAVEALLATS